MRSIARAAWVGVVVLGMGGCSMAPIRAPGARPTPGRPSLQPMTASRAGTGSVRTLCRGERVSGSWAITDYVAARQCDSRGSQTYNAMLVEDLSLYSVGSVVVICADQRRPADWDFTGTELGVTGQCPREPTNKSTSPTVVEIVRHRQSE